jgi:phosphonate metabolism protein PhnN/1,5-bisphosphokinase (PRPP-forming)
MIWQANGLCYGIRHGIEADLRAGRGVIVNGSREYLPQLHQLFPQAQVVWIEADPAQLRHRLESRRRETGTALSMRLQRLTKFAPPPAEEIVVYR